MSVLWATPLLLVLFVFSESEELTAMDYIIKANMGKGKESFDTVTFLSELDRSREKATRSCYNEIDCFCKIKPSVRGANKKLESEYFLFRNLCTASILAPH